VTASGSNLLNAGGSVTVSGSAAAGSSNYIDANSFVLVSGTVSATSGDDLIGYSQASVTMPAAFTALSYSFSPTGVGPVGTTLTDSGTITAGRNVGLQSNGALMVTGTVSGGTTQSGGSVTLNDLAGATTIAGNITATGNVMITVAGTTNNIGNSMTIKPGVSIISSAGNVILEDGLGAVMVAGATISAGTTPGLKDYIAIGATNFSQTGSSKFNASLTVIDAAKGSGDISTLKPFSPFSYNGNLGQFVTAFATLLRPNLVGPGLPHSSISFNDLTTSGALILVGNGTKMTMPSSGSLNVKQLGVIASGSSNSVGANLFGMIGGEGGQAAPSNLQIARAFVLLGGLPESADNNYRFNACAIGSPSCVIVPLAAPKRPDPINNFDFYPQAPDLDNLNVGRVNEGTEDVY
jgi:hypothetical protein